MAKRRLSQRQTERIRLIHDLRLDRAKRRTEKQEQALSADGLGPEQTGLLVANYGASLDVEAADGTLYRCLARQNLEALAVGDRVVWQAARDGQGVVVALQPRRGLLSRPGADGRAKPLAANVDCLFVVAAPRPRYETYLIDQYLAAAEISGVAPAILVNKVDLLDAASREELEADLAPYRALGYPVIFASTHGRHGLDDLLAQLRDHAAVLTGQSGVGKSSLINALVPAAGVPVGELSQRTGVGRHTTSAARLYHLPSGGDVIDSPGVREFRLWPLPSRELLHGFPELRPHAGLCRFRDCRHEGDPGCALEEALQRGEVHPRRLMSFRRMAAEFADNR